MCVDQVLVHHCEKDKVDRESAEKEEKVEDQNTTSANETGCARITNNNFKETPLDITKHS